MLTTYYENTYFPIESVSVMDNSQKPWEDRKGKGHILKGRCSFKLYQ